MSKKLNVNKVKTVDVRALHQRENPLNTRKHLPRVRPSGFYDITEYKEQLLFDNSQQNCNGYEEI